ncbi:MAG: DNA modification methylase [Cocleimonas sp.]|jgi:DNA modification methylase
MKTFIDRTSDFLDLEELKELGRELRSKSAYIVCTSICNDADSSFINALKDTFEYLGMNYGGYIHANCKNGYNPIEYKKMWIVLSALLKILSKSINQNSLK